MDSRNLHVLRLVKATGMPAVSSEFAVSNLDNAMRAMFEKDYLVSALFQQPPWVMDSPEFLRSRHLLGNQDAYRVGADNQMTLETVAAQIPAKVAELCGHVEDSVEEPLSSFGLNSISVAELGAPSFRRSSTTR